MSEKNRSFAAPGTFKGSGNRRPTKAVDSVRVSSAKDPNFAQKVNQGLRGSMARQALAMERFLRDEQAYGDDDQNDLLMDV